MQCIYCHEAIKGTDAYSIRKIGTKEIAWHYLCYTKQSKEIISISTDSKNHLIEYLVKNFPNPEGWALEVLRGCGYGL